jgi:hypothetical protein
MSAQCRLCCKSRKLQGRDFLAKTQNGKQSPIRITSIALPKSPVSFARGDEVPSHLYTKAAPAARRIFGHQCKTSFATQSAKSGYVAFSRLRLETSPAAPLTLHFLVTLFDKTFAFAILAFHFRLACVLLHIFTKFNAVFDSRLRRTKLRCRSSVGLATIS